MKGVLVGFSFLSTSQQPEFFGTRSSSLTTKDVFQPHCVYSCLNGHQSVYSCRFLFDILVPIVLTTFQQNSPGQTGITQSHDSASQQFLHIIYTHWGKTPQFIQKFTFGKSHFSQNSHLQNLTFHKINIYKISFFTKFTFSKPHFSQSSHFSNIRLLVIFGQNVGFCPSVSLKRSY